MGCLSKKVTQLTAQLKCFYMNTCSMGNKKDELEAVLLLESYNTVAIIENY